MACHWEDGDVVAQEVFLNVGAATTGSELCLSDLISRRIRSSASASRWPLPDRHAALDGDTGVHLV